MPEENQHIINRTKIIHCLKEELIGPSPQGNEIDCLSEINYEDIKNKPWRQRDSGEEILTRDSPSIRYGIGVLYPIGTQLQPDITEPIIAKLSDAVNQNVQEYSEINSVEKDDSKDSDNVLENILDLDVESDNLDLSSANIHHPSTIAVSLLAEFPKNSFLRVEATGGRYKRKTVTGQSRPWWLRSPIKIIGEFEPEKLCEKGAVKTQADRLTETNTESLNIVIEVFPRPYEDRKSLLTICLINRTCDDTLHKDETCLFQIHFKVSVESKDGQPHILPYPQPDFDTKDSEERSLSLLYRHARTYAVGHGCAANWEINNPEVYKAYEVTAECLPIYETASITADLTREDGSSLEISMAELAGLVPGEDGFETLVELIQMYREWIQKKKAQMDEIPNEYKDVAKEHLDRCDDCAQRMDNGLKYLSKNKDARYAFELSNHAMLLQQICGNRELREIKYNAQSMLLEFTKDYEEPSVASPQKGKGKWRAFQIAFILMSLESVAEKNSDLHEIVDLIWFPTGGGKTEAYLGLAAYAMFLRRLRDINDTGTDVIMRYTLRLLTSQQFQRSSSLICAMEYLRRQMPEKLGNNEFSIGIWLGGEVTPNRRLDAKRILKGLRNGSKYVENSFVLAQCPWCGAQIGPIRYEDRSKDFPRVVGYEEVGSTVLFKCSDKKSCPFGSHLPIYVIDEDIYDYRPTLVIGTVDKFAILAWRPEARAIFGINLSGNRMYSPPSIIIQDELHLISGPLGSMVGIYESLIEELCTERRGKSVIKPKIISSTATIRRYSEQIKSLYARNKVVLFPPPGIEADDSFFAAYARSNTGELFPGKIYVGVHAPSHGSIQTSQVRVFTSLLQSPMSFTPEMRDPWWTLVVFFNSLRELGNTHSLLQSDIRNRFSILQNRLGIKFSDMRQFLYPKIMELTSRKTNAEIHQAIPELKVSYTDEAKPVDVCLASNIIEVGIDIDRLSLLSIVGQPKTTSQYIQVTGRIGRLWKERPGLVVTIYSPTKPRDRSHFEKFRSYHEKLYAQVEPSSLTPFSVPALRRALHAIMVAFVRQCGNEQNASSPSPYPDKLLKSFMKIMVTRLQHFEDEELMNFQKIFSKRTKEWKTWERMCWESLPDDTDAPLLTRAGAYINPEWYGITWPTPTSMRNVDAECEMQITTLYLKENKKEDKDD